MTIEKRNESLQTFTIAKVYVYKSLRTITIKFMDFYNENVSESLSMSYHLSIFEIPKNIDNYGSLPTP